ncbi:hypothetical protein PMAYCL1PPCAC_25948, partial [Pristionchus mayeri]
SHICYDGLYISSLFGPVLQTAPRWLVDILFLFGFLLNIGWWQLTPAPCIMQYLHLFNGLRKQRTMTTFESLVSSYAFSLFLLTFTAIWARDLIPTPEFEETLRAAIRRAYNLSESDRFMVYGLNLDNGSALNNGRSLKDIAFIAFLPTYAAAYSAFFIVIHRRD